jgi:hypothetical protein
MSIPVERIAGEIRLLRGQRVLLDADLAALYGVSTKRLNEQVRRNLERFPGDFMFQLTAAETDSLRSQNATSKKGRGGRRTRPCAFTEHGAIMAATVLNSPQAVEMSVFVVRAFVRLRELLTSSKALTRKLAELEARLEGHDQAIADIITAIRELMTPSAPEKRRGIGFTADFSDSPDPKGKKR